MGSAIVDSFGVPYPFRPLREQVEQFFLPNYGGGPNGTGRVRWRSDETLFVFFFGINDVNGAVMQARNSTSNTTNSDAATFLDSTLSRIVSAYDRHIETLYTSGARNYMFLTVPAIHRAPASVVQGEEVVEALRVAVLDFNDRIRNMVVEMLRRHADAAAFILDTFALFDEVLDEPESRVETGVYRNTTGFCEAYARYP
jgi:phospholipase/lecithinase/hemolysin